MKRFRTFALPVLLLAALVISRPTLAAPEKFDIDPVHSRVEFLIRHMFSKVSGRFDDFKGQIAYDPGAPSACSVTAEIDAKTLTTANQRRDAHLKSPDFFDVAKFPTLTYTSGKITPLPSGKMKVEGTLTMHGISRPVTMEAAFLGSGPDPAGVPRAGFEASAKLDRKEFGIVWNKTLDQGGTLLGDDVTINIQIEAAMPQPGDSSEKKDSEKEKAKSSK